MATLAVILLGYRVGLLRAAERLTRGVLVATGAVALEYVVSIVLGFFGTAPSIGGEEAVPLCRF